MNNNDVQKQLAKLRRNKKFLWLGILFFVLVVLWILVSVFSTTKTSAISKELRDLSKSFVPRLESKVFDEIADKRAFTQEELALFSIFVFNKSEIEEKNAIIDIIVKPNTEDEDQSEQKILVEPEATFTEVDATASSNMTEPITATESGAQEAQEASASSMSVPQSVTDFLDYMVANN